MVNKSYKVKLVTTPQFQTIIDKLPVVVRGDAKADNMGMCDPQTSSIYINLDMHPTGSDMEHTFCHELVHALLFADGLSEHNEEQVDRLGGILHQYFLTKVDR